MKERAEPVYRIPGTADMLREQYRPFFHRMSQYLKQYQSNMKRHLQNGRKRHHTQKI